MKEYRLSEKTLLLWRIRAIIIGLVFIIASIMLTKSKIVLFCVSFLISLIFSFVIFWYLPKLLKTCSCKVVNNTVVLKIGVFFKTIHVFPLLRLIYSQTVTTPLAYIMGLTSVTLKAARNRVFIPEMNREDAKEFTEFLLRGGTDEI